MNEYRHPTIEEIDALTRQASRARSAMLAGLFRGLVCKLARRPADPRPAGDRLPVGGRGGYVLR